MSIWVSLSEAADLEGIDYETAKKQYQRMVYISKTEPNPNGGKAQVYIALESLSEHAQKLYWRREREDIYKKRAEWMHDNEVAPWYYDVDIGWFLKRYQTEYNQAAGLAQEIEKYYLEKSLHRKETTLFTKEFARDRLGMCDRQFRRYLKRYNEACNWAMTKEMDTEQNYSHFKTLSLCEPPRVGMGQKLTPEMKAVIENIWSSEKFQKNNCSIKMLYDIFCERMVKKMQSTL